MILRSIFTQFMVKQIIVSLNRVDMHDRQNDPEKILNTIRYFSDHTQFTKHI